METGLETGLLFFAFFVHLIDNNSPYKGYLITKSLTTKEKKEYLSKSDILEGDNDPTVLNLTKEEFDEWIVKYNLHDAHEWIERFSNQ